MKKKLLVNTTEATCLVSLTSAAKEGKVSTDLAERGAFDVLRGVTTGTEYKSPTRTNLGDESSCRKSQRGCKKALERDEGTDWR